MKSFRHKFCFLLIIILLASHAESSAQTKGVARGRNPERSLFGKSRKVKTKETKVKEPRAVTKAKREQEKKKKKSDREYKNYVADSRKRAYRIQTAEVQSRMKQNEKDIKARDKERKKNGEQSTKRGRKKYNK